MDHQSVPSPSTSSVTVPSRELPFRALANAARGTLDTVSQMSPPNSDISSVSTLAEITPEKYQRLATEYAKIRSHFVVLKKAVIDEQGKNGDLQETLKQRDQELRRTQQETESLVFRNKQLTKRISVLQSDLEHTDSAGNQNKRSLIKFPDLSKNRSASNASTASSVPSVDADLFDEINSELKSKMEENERLRQLVNNLEAKRDQELTSLEGKLREADTRAELQIETLNGEVRSLSGVVSKVTGEKNEILAKLHDCFQMLQDTTGTMENLKQENTELKNRVIVAEKQLQAAKQNARLQAAQQAQGPPATLTAADTNGIFRSGSFSGIVRSSGSFSRPGLPRSGSLSINHSGSPTLANLLLSSQSSQSTKELSQQQGSSAAAHQQATSPSHSSKAYADVASKQTLLTEFATKIAQITCALSTLHSNVSKKISILYALFNNNVNHLYFVDVAAFSDESMPPHAEDGAISNGFSNRSEYIMNILRKFNDSLKSGYSTHLVHLEEAVHQFISAKIRFYQQQEVEETSRGGHKTGEVSPQLGLIAAEMAQHSSEIVDKFDDYLNHLNKVNPYMTLCLNIWHKNVKEYNPKNSQMLKAIGLSPAVQGKLANDGKRGELCTKQEQLTAAVSNFIRVLGQMYSQIKLLLSPKATLKPNYLTVFNHFLHRMNALEKAFEEVKDLFASKLALEHDLGITVEGDLLSVDDAILSSIVFLRQAIKDLKVMVEMHYFFFVGHSGSNTGSQATSPLTITGQFIPEEEEEEDEEDSGDDCAELTPDKTVGRAPQMKPPVSATSNLPATCKGIASSQGSTQSPQENGGASMRPSDQMNAKSARELAQLRQEKEQWLLENELAQLKFAEEQRKVADLEIRLQTLLTQMSSTKPPPSHVMQSGSSASQNNQTAAEQQSVPCANSTSNSLKSTKSQEAAATNAAELGSISSAASLQSPTVDCFGTVAYPSIGEPAPAVLANIIDGVLREASASGQSKVNATSNGTTSEGEEQAIAESAQSNASSKYQEEKLRQLLDALQLTDSRALALQAECNAIHAHYLQLKKEKEQQDQTLSVVTEEYQTSVENYEFQLRTMSEHLAELNEKLAAQREEIDVLKYQQETERRQQQQQSGGGGKTSFAASTVAKTFRRSFKKS